MTPVLELICAGIVVLYVNLQVQFCEDKGEFYARIWLVAIAAWAGEDTMIRAYGFYAYDAGWHVFVDRVPLLVPLIWFVVVDSAERLARALRGGALTAALLVLADACLIEPICVRAGLWSWTAPGPFDVPVVGVLGWAFFGGAAVALLRWRSWAVLAAPVAAHALVLAAWWGALRWTGVPPLSACLVVAWVASLALAAWAWRARPLVPPMELVARVPGAVFFFALLAVGHASWELVGWACAFVPPYLVLLAASRKSHNLPAGS